MRNTLTTKLLNYARRLQKITEHKTNPFRTVNEMRIFFCLKIILLLVALDATFAQVYPFNPQHVRAPLFDQGAQNHSCWNDNVVPYLICPTFSQSQKDYIKEKIALLHGATCIRWIDLSENPGSITDVVVFQKVTVGNCRVTWERPHRNLGYVVYVRLLDRCFDQHWVLHEMMHVLGFHNEHQRSDRNCFVHVHINAVNYSQYRLMRHDDWVERYPYDKFSVMHGRTSFLMSGKDERWVDSYDPLGNKEGLLSYLDYNKIRYKFCGGRHFCKTSPNTCKDFEHAKKVQNCGNYVPWHG